MFIFGYIHVFGFFPDVYDPLQVPFSRGMFVYIFTGRSAWILWVKFVTATNKVIVLK